MDDAVSDGITLLYGLFALSLLVFGALGGYVWAQRDEPMRAASRVCQGLAAFGIVVGVLLFVAARGSLSYAEAAAELVAKIALGEAVVLLGLSVGIGCGSRVSAAGAALVIGVTTFLLFHGVKGSPLVSLVTFLRLFVASVCVRALASPQGEVLRSAPARTSWALPAGRPVLDASPAEAAPVVAPPLAAPGTSEAPSGTLLRRKGAPADAGPTAVGRVCPPCGRTFAAMRERCTACGGPLALEGAA